MIPIDYSFAPTTPGEVLLAATGKGICALFFTGGPDSRGGATSRAGAIGELKKLFPEAEFTERTTPAMRQALAVFDGGDAHPVPLDLRGTPFQTEVWEALMEIPRGETTTYGAIAARIGRPGACRAVGSAVGANPVSVIVPCHRVVRSGSGRNADGGRCGALGGYRWGIERKKALLKDELEGGLQR